MATVTVENMPLVLNSFAAILQNNLVSADLVEWRKMDKEMNDRNALTVIDQREPRYAVYQTSSGIKDLTSPGVQDTVFGSEAYTCTETFNTSMGWGDWVKIRDIGDARESKALNAAAHAMAEQIDMYVMRKLAVMSNNWVGTAGNAINDVDDILTAYTRLKVNGVTDENLRAILTYSDKQALGTAVAGVAAFADGLASDTFRNSFSGSVGGIPTIFSQNVAAFTTGTRAGAGSSAALINGASQNVNYADVANSTTNGQYMTQTIAIDTLTGTKTLVEGDVFTIANVYAYDNRAQQTLDHLQQFVVVSTGTSSSGAIAALRIYPAMIVPGSGSGGNVAVNTAHATVNAAPADDAPLTIIGAASTAYKPRLIVAKDAAVMSCADLSTPYSDTMMRKSLSKIPLSVRVWKHSDFNTGAHSIRFDCATTFNIYDRNKIIRVNGG